jgi:hypothetical protein
MSASDGTSEGFMGDVRRTDDRINVKEIRTMGSLYKDSVTETNPNAWKWFETLLERSQEVEDELNQLKKERADTLQVLKIGPPPDEEVNKQIAAFSIALVSEKLLIPEDSDLSNTALSIALKLVLQMARCHLNERE